jgi:Transposase DDE domain
VSDASTLEIVRGAEKDIRSPFTGGRYGFYSSRTCPRAFSGRTRSLTIFRMASIGTARIAPGKPHIQNQNTSVKMIRTGFNVKRRATSIGVSVSPSQGKLLVQFRRTFATPRSGITKDGTRLYRSSKSDCQRCAFKAKCCPNTPQRKVPRDLDEDARDVALANTPAYERSRHRRKKVEMLFAHLKRILRLGRLRLRGPSGARDEFLLAATAQNLRKLAKLRAMPAACPVPA